MKTANRARPQTRKGQAKALLRGARRYWWAIAAAAVVLVVAFVIGGRGGDPAPVAGAPATGGDPLAGYTPNPGPAPTATPNLLPGQVSLEDWRRTQGDTPPPVRRDYLKELDVYANMKTLAQPPTKAWLFDQCVRQRDNVNKAPRGDGPNGNATVDECLRRWHAISLDSRAWISSGWAERAGGPVSYDDRGPWVYEREDDAPPAAPATSTTATAAPAPAAPATSTTATAAPAPAATPSLTPEQVRTFERKRSAVGIPGDAPPSPRNYVQEMTAYDSKIPRKFVFDRCITKQTYRQGPGANETPAQCLSMWGKELVKDQWMVPVPSGYYDYVYE